jgi:hypothetical protein
VGLKISVKLSKKTYASHTSHDIHLSKQRSPSLKARYLSPLSSLRSLFSWLFHSLCFLDFFFFFFPFFVLSQFFFILSQFFLFSSLSEFFFFFFFFKLHLLLLLELELILLLYLILSNENTPSYC